MVNIFLHGGGGQLQANDFTFGRFVQAVGAGRIALIKVDADEAAGRAELAEYREILVSCGASEAHLHDVWLSPQTALTQNHLEAIDPKAVFVCGGATPEYHAALCQDKRWLDYLNSQNAIYFGTSSGAAIASRQAIIGGWQAQRGDHTTQILFSGAGEGLNLLEIRDGLGLVSFSAEIHASQWGTTHRLLHAVDLGLVHEGWAIDEDTQLEIDGGQITVSGLGQAYRVSKRQDDSLSVRIHSGR